MVGITDGGLGFNVHYEIHTPPAGALSGYGRTSYVDTSFSRGARVADAKTPQILQTGGLEK